MGRFFLAIAAVLLLASCYRTDDPLIGRWTVEKVNVEFNENIATPEMVRQYGEMEKGNIIEIGKDSILTFVSEGDTLKAQCSLKGQQLYCDGVVFGILKDGKLVTESNSPIGTIVVTYQQ